VQNLCEIVWQRRDEIEDRVAVAQEEIRRPTGEEYPLSQHVIQFEETIEMEEAIKATRQG